MIGLYIHIPYCIQKCRYCDFTSVPLNETAAQYADAVLTELTLRRAQFPTERVRSVFFGGGTPTALPADDLCRILDGVRATFPVEEDAEISFECNPKTAHADALKKLRDHGFNRISIGLQATQDDLLRRIGRIHSFSDYLQTMQWAQDAGFTNRNVDLMHGLPTQTQAQYLDAIRTIASQNPTHLSAYSLILEEGTPLYRDVTAGRETLPSADAVADMEDAGIALMEQLGYHRYEVSNFAKDGYRCAHNQIYWRNEPYLGVGVAAHSSMQEGGYWVRFANTSSIPQYIRRLQQGKLAQAERIVVNTFEQMFESVMLGLRTTDGLDCGAFFKRFDCDVCDVYAEAITKNEALFDFQDPSYLRLTPRGMDVLDAVLRDFRAKPIFNFLS